MRLKKVILSRFCGFNEFEVEIGDFTVLVGPNNGGKTTILRAVKFGLDAVRVICGDQTNPNYGPLREPAPRAGLQHVARRLGVHEFDQLYHGRLRREPSTVSLVFQEGPSELCVEATCESARNNITLRLTYAGQSLSDLPEKDADGLIDALYSMNVEFVPPAGSISPTEPLLHWNQLQDELAQGKISETWRNRLHWMIEGGDPELFQRVVDRVREYISDVRIRPPRRSKTTSTVEVNYVENDVEYDISASGGGLRTLITLAAAIEVSDAPILLFDEPDSHLHSSVQRQVARLLEDATTDTRQILVATHAPDFIEEVGLDSLVWVDRSDSGARDCDDVGKALVDLGAISHTQALQHVGADTLIYVEGKADQKVFAAILNRCGKMGLVRRCRLERLGGYGDEKNLPSLYRLLTRFKHLKIAVAAILDADYTQTKPSGNCGTDGGVLIIRLPCKELENLFLLTDDVLAKATAAESERRNQHTGEECVPPSIDEIRQHIEKFTGAEDVKEAIRTQWICRWAKEQHLGPIEAGQLKEAEDEFKKRWSDVEWRRRCCPGKLVLRHLRRWLKAEYKLSVGLSILCKSYEPSNELRGLFDKLESHVQDSLA